MSNDDSIFNQVLKNRELGSDTESIPNTKQNNSEVAKDSSIVEEDNTASTSTPSWYELEQLGPRGPVIRSYDEIKAKYPDKTILTVIGIVPSDFITDSINNYLVQNGTDYVVFFQSMTEEQSVINVHANDHQMPEERKQAIYELLDTVDIMVMDRNNYFELASKGYFEPWNNFLSTEEGMKLYKSIPENNWKSCDVDGEIYGINGRSDFVFRPPSYIVNKDIMNKYNISEEDLNKPIYELEDILKIVAKVKKKTLHSELL